MSRKLVFEVSTGDLVVSTKLVSLVSKTNCKNCHTSDLPAVSSIVLSATRNKASDVLPTTTKAVTTSDLVPTLKEAVTNSQTTSTDVQTDIPKEIPSSKSTDSTSFTNVLETDLKTDQPEEENDEGHGKVAGSEMTVEPTSEYAQYKADVKHQIFTNIVKWMEKNVPVLLKKVWCYFELFLFIC